MKMRAVEPDPNAVLLKDTFSHVISFTKTDNLKFRREVVTWGEETIGPFVARWGLYAVGGIIVKAYFHSETDALMFLMRWWYGRPGS